MLITGTAEVQRVNETNMKSRPLRSCVMTKMKNDSYYLLLRNSMFPNSTEYRVADIETVHDKYVAEGKLGLQFKNPSHIMLIRADDKRALKIFTRQIHDIIAGNNVVIAARNMPKTVPIKRHIMNRFSPLNVEFQSVDNHFDLRILNMVHLTKLVLDNCTLSSMPEQLGNLPIQYLSLNNVRVPSTGSRRDQDMFWNWMCMDKISRTLETLKIDNIGLNKLPFELMYMKKLETLSLANNYLRYLPHYIGNLRKLKNLNVSGNLLNYLPDVLDHENFLQLDISNNRFLMAENFVFEMDHIYSYVTSCDQIRSPPKGNIQSLRDLSFYSLFVNGVKFKRQEIPRTLWHLYEVLFCCKFCCKIRLPTKVYLVHTFTAPFALVSLVKSHNDDLILYQRIACYCLASRM